MTRSELVARLAPHFPQLTQQDAYVSVSVILDAIGDRLAAGDRVEIRGFGSFQVNVRPPRMGRNPKTGVKVPVPAKPAVQFKPGVEMRERVNVLAPQRYAATLERTALRGSVLEEGDIISPVDVDWEALHERGRL